jgi:hypothetical protein
VRGALPDRHQSAARRLIDASLNSSRADSDARSHPTASDPSDEATPTSASAKSQEQRRQAVLTNMRGASEPMIEHAECDKPSIEYLTPSQALPIDARCTKMDLGFSRYGMFMRISAFGCPFW